jgi:hypothetical protein
MTTRPQGRSRILIRLYYWYTKTPAMAHNADKQRAKLTSNRGTHTHYTADNTPTGLWTWIQFLVLTPHGQLAVTVIVGIGRTVRRRRRRTRSRWGLAHSRTYNIIRRFRECG